MTHTDHHMCLLFTPGLPNDLNNLGAITIRQIADKLNL